MATEWTEESLLELTGSFQKCRIVLSAAELDLFTLLAPGPKTVEQLCASTGLSPRGVTILLDALAALEIVRRSQDGRYSVDATVGRYLSRDGEGTVLPMVLHRAHMWESWSHLSSIVRTGEAPHPLAGKKPRSLEEMEAFIGAMHVVGKSLAARIADSLDLSPFRRMLDVGGGSGTYTMAFLAASPQLTATVFDLPEVIEMARKRLEEEGFIERVRLMAGDYTADELPAGNDLALLSAIIHINSREANRELLGKCYRALENGGMILIRDYALDDSRTYPPEGALFAVNMLAATRAGSSYTLSEITEDLESAGFKDVRLLRNGRHMDQVIGAVK
jgi:ubiquinone/menaquinone biosynthesis C-methylase UbiE